MRINQNISAMNTHASMVKADSAMSKSLERLSSGYRINRAADDAAGLAISEKMRGQISGLKQATKNAQDGISLLQTAEGNLNETHSILQRMRELADQAANGTVTDSDRAEIQKEMNQLTKEVDRIAKDTEFNTMKLLRGQKAAISMSGTVTTNNATGVSSSALTGGVKASGSVDLGTGNIVSGTKLTVGTTVYTLKSSAQATNPNDIAIGANNTATAAAIAAKIGASATASGTEVTFSAAQGGTGGNATALSLTTAADGAIANTTTTGFAGGTNEGATGSLSFDRQLQAGDKFSVNGTEYTMVAAGTQNPTAQQILLGADLAGTVDNITTKLEEDTGIAVSQSTDGKSINITGTATVASTAINTTLADASKSSSSITLTMQIGANAGQSMDVDINNMDAGSLGIGRDAAGNAVAAGTDATQGLDVTSSTTASNSLTAIDTAINRVSSERSKLGAFQNRLDHTVSNLSTAAENLSSSESRIRDVDMADEMSNFSRAQILMQASTAMMAQANQKPQAVLKLLG